MASFPHFVTSLSVFRFIANLEQFGLPDFGLIAVKLTFLLEVTFYLTKTENITKKSPTELSHYCFE